MIKKKDSKENILLMLLNLNNGFVWILMVME